MAHDVFISYSHVDKPTADAACAALEAAGIRCWIAPRDIAPGAEWGEAIVNAIDHARVMVLIFSSNTNESRQVSREVERAVSQGVTIMPLRIEQADPARSLAYFMAGVHWLDAMTPPIEQHLQTLARSITALLQAAPGDEEGGDIRERRFRAPPARRSRRWVIATLVLIVLIAAGAGAVIVRSGWLKLKPTEEVTTPSPVPPAEPGTPAAAAKQEEFHPTIAYNAPVPPPKAPSPTPPRPASVPAPPPEPTPLPSAPAATTLYDGFWSGVRDCPAWEGRPAFASAVSMTIQNGKASAATKFAVDAPGYLTFQGMIDGKGGLVLTGYGVSGGLPGGLPRGQRYVFDFQGTISGEVFSAKQVGFPRPCTLTMNRGR